MEMETLNHTSMLKRYIERVKLATAVAVIKCKPADMSSEAFAIHLSELALKRLWTSNSECLKLEELMQNLKMGEHHSKEDVSEVNDCTSLGTNWQQYLSICSSNDAVEFLKTNLVLKDISSNNGCKIRTENDVKTVLSTLSKLFRYLQSSFGLKLSIEVIKQSFVNIQSVLQLELYGSNDSVIQCCLTFLNSLLCDILEATEINMLNSQQRRCVLIGLLAELPQLTLPVQYILMEKVISFVHMVKSCEISNEDNMLIALENIYYVLQCLERVVSINLKQRSGNSESCIRLPCELANEWDSVIHHCMMSVGTHFPLFSMYVWHIHSSIFPQNSVGLDKEA